MKPVSAIVVWTIVFTVLLPGCGEPNQHQRWYIPDSASQAAAVESKGDIYGHYVCTDFTELAGARKSVKMVRTRPLFLEIVFKPEYGDSVLLITAYENFFTLWKHRTNNWIEIKNVLPNRDVLLFIHEGYREISLTDTLNGSEGGKQVHSWVFTKTAGDYPAKGGDKPTMVYGWINKEIIAGNYTFAGNSTPVTFDANGTITGWELYNHYEICLGGDCFRLTRTPMDIITLGGAGGKEHFGLVVEPDSVYFYSLANSGKGGDFSHEPKNIAWAMGKN